MRFIAIDRPIEGNDHVVELTATEWGIQHPIACRPNLLACRYHRYMKEAGKPDIEDGDYFMAISVLDYAERLNDA